MIDTGDAANGASRRRYELMLGNSATAAICAGRDNLITSWNTAAESLFGYSAETAIGQPLSMIVPARHRAAHDAALARAARHGVARLAGHSVDLLALHADGSEIAVDLSLSMWFEDGEPLFGALIRNISDRASAKKRLEYLAHCDLLTSLPNRNALQEYLAAQLAKAPCALLLLDLDDFKQLNDIRGNSVGDALLAAVAARLVAAVRDSGYVARTGGDEFAVVLPDCTDPLQINTVANRIFESLKPAFELAGQSVHVGTSIGIALSPADGSGVQQLLSAADLALCSSKRAGGGVRTFFSRAMQATSEQKHRLNTELRQALAAGEFELLYQPQVWLSDFSLSGAEALLRWQHPDHGHLAPGAFIEVLGTSTIAEPVGDWIIDRACADLAAWQHKGLHPLRVGVNLFPAQLRSGLLYSTICSALQKHGLEPWQIELEITESTALSHDDQSTNVLRRLKALGVSIAFDDFGTGFASLSLLQKFPLDRIKIDRSFVKQIDVRAGDAAIVKALVQMASSMGLKVIAEGIETAAQEATLIRLGCKEAQGYRYGRPMSADELYRTFTADRRAPFAGRFGATARPSAGSAA